MKMGSMVGSFSEFTFAIANENSVVYLASVDESIADEGVLRPEEFRDQIASLYMSIRLLRIVGKNDSVFRLFHLYIYIFSLSLGRRWESIVVTSNQFLN